MQWPIEPLNRVTFRDTAHLEAHSLELYHSCWAMTCPLSEHSSSYSALITSSTALNIGLAALLQETSPLALYKKERWADRKSSRPSTLRPELLWELCEEFMNKLNSILWHFIKFDSFQDPKSDLESKPSQIDSFQDPYILHPKWTHFKTLMFLDPNWLISRPRAVNYPKHHPIDLFQDPHIGLYSVLISMGDYLQIDSTKSPWETSFNLEPLKLPTQWNSDLISRQPEAYTSHTSIWLISRPQDNMFCTIHSNIPQKWLLSRPQNLHSQLFAVTFVKSDFFQDPDTGQGCSYSSSHRIVHTH